nr:MAG TPA: hypothetical protein [Caudoviricetes sp.]
MPLLYRALSGLSIGFSSFFQIFLDIALWMRYNINVKKRGESE